MWNIPYLLQYYHLTYPPFSPFLVLGSLLSETMFSVLRLVVNLSFFLPCALVWFSLFLLSFIFFFSTSLEILVLPCPLIQEQISWSPSCYKYHSTTILLLSCLYLNSHMFNSDLFFFFSFVSIIFLPLDQPFFRFLAKQIQTPTLQIIYISHHPIPSLFRIISHNSCLECYTIPSSSACNEVSVSTQ